jgi:2-dehydropantoate 2-reductase
MKVLVWGVGAIGGTVAAYLARAGHEIIVVDQASDHVEAINQNGLHLTGPVDEFVARMAAFTPQTVHGQYDTIFLCVKAHHTHGAMQTLRPHLSEDGCVVSLQNGLNEQVIAGIVGEARTIGAFINFGADYIGPGVIHRGNRATVVIGELDGKITPRIESLHRLLLDFDDRAFVTSNIWGYLWGKLSYGALLFATALTNESIADVLAAPEYRDVLIALATEVLRVAAAKGVTPEHFDGFDPQAFMPSTLTSVSTQSLDNLVAFNRKSAKTHSGIWRDLAVRKRRTEVDAQLGAVVETGDVLGIPAPLTARLVELIHDIEDGKRPLSWDNLTLLKEALT